jgi:KDO2-lipid IV(A) lauroyltransferase
MQVRPAWWVRLLAALPWWVMNPFADVIAWLSWRVVRVEQRALRANLTASFPTLTEAQLQQLMRGYYRGFAQVLVEVVRSVNLSPQELRRRVVREGF